MGRDVRLNFNALRVMAALYHDATGEQYGLSLAAATTLGNGTLYPILDKLEGSGLITARWEDLDERAAGRRARRFYTLTAEGVRRFEAARAQLHPGGLSTHTP